MNYDYSINTIPAISPVYWFISLALCILYAVSLALVFKKAGKAPWAAIIPIYNVIVMFQIAKMSGWMVLLMFIPIANVIVAILMTINIAKAFDKGTGFILGLIILPMVFIPILAFDSSEYDENLI
jgi:hypothetical protein